MTSRQFLASFADSDRCLGEGELCLEAAGRKVALVVELPGVGHPFVD